MKVIKKIPLPAAGVMLGVAALGNLLASYSETLRLCLGIVAGVIGVLLLVKYLTNPGDFKKEMGNPITASVSGTFPMALMLLAGMLVKFAPGLGKALWFVAIGLHLLLIIYFTGKFILGFELKNVYASYFIVYVGIAVASVTSPAMGMEKLGQAAFWFAFVSLVILLVLVTLRYIKCPEIPEPARPLFAIYTAPASLCLAGYLQAFPVKARSLALGLALLAGCLYLMVLVSLPKLLKLAFYPSYAAFTFPFVISAIGMKMLVVFLKGPKGTGQVPGVLPNLVLCETILAVLLVTYTLVRYLMAVLKK